MYKMYYKENDITESFFKKERITIHNNMYGHVVMLGCDGKSFAIDIYIGNKKAKTKLWDCVGSFNEFVKYHRMVHYER